MDKPKWHLLHKHYFCPETWNNFGDKWINEMMPNWVERGFILVRPLTMKVKPTSSCDWDYVCLDNQEAESLDLALEKLFRPLNRRRVVPLYTEVDAQRLYRVPTGS